MRRIYLISKVYIGKRYPNVLMYACKSEHSVLVCFEHLSMLFSFQQNRETMSKWIVSLLSQYVCSDNMSISFNWLII